MLQVVVQCFYMNRPIKFRVWDSERKIMEEVGAMDWADGKNGLEILTVNTETKKYYKMPDDWGEQSFFVMQFTGLLDENGKEIYEGDVIQYTFKTLEGSEIFTSSVVFDESMWLTDEHSLNRCSEIEVIGNIYDKDV